MCLLNYFDFAICKYHVYFVIKSLENRNNFVYTYEECCHSLDDTTVTGLDANDFELAEKYGYKKLITSQCIISSAMYQVS